MIGKQPSIPDIVLQLKELVQPSESVESVDLYCHEELQAEPEEEPEDPAKTPYKVVVQCGSCQARLRLFVLSTDLGIRTFQELLFGEIELLCIQCRERLEDGRQ